MVFENYGQFVRRSDSASPEAVSEALYAVGHWLVSAERFEDGKHIFRSMLRSTPADERAWIALALCHERTSELEKAERLLNLSLQACPKSARAHLARARLLREQGRLEESDAAFGVAVEVAEMANEEELAAAIAGERAAL